MEVWKRIEGPSEGVDGLSWHAACGAVPVDDGSSRRKGQGRLTRRPGRPTAQGGQPPLCLSSPVGVRNGAAVQSSSCPMKPSAGLR